MSNDLVGRAHSASTSETLIQELGRPEGLDQAGVAVVGRALRFFYPDDPMLLCCTTIAIGCFRAEVKLQRLPLPKDFDLALESQGC